MIVKIKRIAYLPNETLGVLFFDNVPFCLTLEDPWKDNEKRVSCIPTGNYTAQRKFSPKFGNTFEIENVIGRSHILFHAGNTHHDTSGCILLGSEFGTLDGANAILESSKAFHKFKERLHLIDNFNLRIES